MQLLLIIRKMLIRLPAGKLKCAQYTSEHTVRQCLWQCQKSFFAKFPVSKRCIWMRVPDFVCDSDLEYCLDDSWHVAEKKDDDDGRQRRRVVRLRPEEE
jgi:hypothetical protein